MASRQVTIQNDNGIHCRPSALIIKEVQQHAENQVTLQHGDSQCDPGSILSLMSMGLSKGDQVRVEVTGPEAERVADRMAELLERHFDFPPQSEPGNEQ